MTAVNASSPGGAAVPHLSLDPFSIEYFDDLHPSQERLREAGPLVYLDKWKVYGVARHAEVHAVLKRPRRLLFEPRGRLKRFCQGDAVASAEHHP